MQPQTLHRSAGGRADGLVIGLLRTDDEALGAALHAIAVTPELLETTSRIVVIDRGRTPAPHLVEAALLRPGLLHIVRRPGADRPAALAAVLQHADAEADAGAVLLLDDAAVDTAALLEAVERARTSDASDVVGLTASPAARPAPAAWWGALLPLDAVRAVGYTVPEAGELALAELVLRADAAGFRASVVRAAAPMPAASPVDGLLIALVHAPLRERSRLLAAGLVADLRALLAFRTGAVQHRHARLRALLRGPGGASAEAHSVAARASLPADAVRLHVRLWVAWPRLRRAYRKGAVERASAESWARRSTVAEVDGTPTRADRETTLRRPAGLRLRAWSTARRRTSAA